MPRDYTQLRVYHMAKELALEIYQVTRSFPREEQFGLTSQMRRAATSIPANIVEGCYRFSEAEYLNFLNIALGSAGELGFFIEFSEDLKFIAAGHSKILKEKHSVCTRSLQSLVSSLRKPKAQSLKSKAY